MGRVGVGDGLQAKKKEGTCPFPPHLFVFFSSGAWGCNFQSYYKMIFVCAYYDVDSIIGAGEGYISEKK